MISISLESERFPNADFTLGSAGHATLLTIDSVDKCCRTVISAPLERCSTNQIPESELTAIKRCKLS